MGCVERAGGGLGPNPRAQPSQQRCGETPSRRGRCPSCPSRSKSLEEKGSWSLAGRGLGSQSIHAGDPLAWADLLPTRLGREGGLRLRQRTTPSLPLQLISAPLKGPVQSDARSRAPAAGGLVTGCVSWEGRVEVRCWQRQPGLTLLSWEAPRCPRCSDSLSSSPPREADGKPAEVDAGNTRSKRD